MARKTSSLSVTDLFCGAGGSSAGMHQASSDVTVELALNHWRLAIENHAANFPDTAHDCADVSATDPRRYRSTTVLWASPSCVNHSLAKGQKRRYDAQLELFGKIVDDAAAERSRATMFDVPRFAECHDYDVVVVENVVDVRHWRLYDAWLHAMHLLGYDHREVYFNSMFAHLDPAAVRQPHDYAPQSRDRIYVVFWKKGNKAPDLEFRPKGWCGKCARDVEAVQAWKNPRKKWGRYGWRNQYVYRCPACASEVVPYHFAAWNAIDWSLPAERIGDRKKPLEPRTMDRIRKGLEKFGNTWLVMDTAYANGDRSRPMLAAMPTQTGTETFGVVMPFYLGYANGEAPAHGVDEPLPTLPGGRTPAVVMPFLTSYYSASSDGRAVLMPFSLGYADGDSRPRAVTEEMLTLHTQNNAGVVFPAAPPAVEDCGFRMLQPHEVQRGMAFPDSYVMLGTKRDRVRLAGNAVTPPVAKMLMRRILPTLS